MRKFVAPVLSAVLMVGVAASVVGCKASASASIGEGKPKAPKAAPPPPPAPKPPPPAPEPKSEPAPKPKKVTFQTEGNQLKLPGPVVFKTGSAELAPESDEVLSIVKEYLDAKPQITLLRIEGHTDSDGDDKANQKLSEERSMSVARWLIAKGIDCKRLHPVGFGESKPIADNNTPEGKAQNRRTAFVNAALKGKPIAGLPIDGGGKYAGDPCK